MSTTTLVLSAPVEEAARVVVQRLMAEGWDVDRKPMQSPGGRTTFEMTASKQGLVGNVYGFVDEIRSGLTGIKFVSQIVH